MFQMIRGCKVQDASQLTEGYQRTRAGYRLQVSAEKIRALMEGFLSLQQGYVFLIVEVPTNAKDEPKNEKGEITALHMDVYYRDGLSREDALELLKRCGELLIHDGVTRFGFGSHDSHDEIIKENYNVLTLFSAGSAAYEQLFEVHEIKRVPELRTAWDYFTEATPGESYFESKSICGLIEYLKKYGLYFAERREA